MNGMDRFYVVIVGNMMLSLLLLLLLSHLIWFAYGPGNLEMVHGEVQKDYEDLLSKTRKYLMTLIVALLFTVQLSMDLLLIQNHKSNKFVSTSKLWLQVTRTQIVVLFLGFSLSVFLPNKTFIDSNLHIYSSIAVISAISARALAIYTVNAEVQVQSGELISWDIPTAQII